MKNKIKEIRNKYMNKKGASMMEFFVLTLVVLLIGAAVFIVSKVMRDGVDKMEQKTDGMNNTLDSNSDGFNAFN